MMDGPDEMVQQLDTDFDQMLADMKPHVLRLPHKSDRQKCALWIKKFCEPPASGINGRKNRNMYSQLLLHMLRRGLLEGPFLQNPETGPLPTLPSYMSIYFDDLKSPKTKAAKANNLPDWVNGELCSELVNSNLSSSIRSASGDGANINPLFSSFGVSESYKRIENEKSPSDTRSRSHRNERDEFLASIHSRETKEKANSDKLPTNRLAGITVDITDDSTNMMQRNGDFDRHLDKPVFNASSLLSSSTVGGLHNDTSVIRMHEREIDMKSKMFEAKFQEEKLRLQQKHDATVQKILDRKNSEIEELKSHYRNKNTDQGEQISKLEKTLNALQKDFTSMKDMKDHQIEEMKITADENKNIRQAEYEKKMHDMVAEFEQQKFDLQKQHTKNIQELLDDTNTRLHRMEDEYNQQTSATSVTIKELEARVFQLSTESETLSAQRSQLEREKLELESKIERLQTDLQECQTKFSSLENDHKRHVSESDQDIRTLKSKHDASIEFLKQEHHITTVKLADNISDLEQHVSQLKNALENAEQQRNRQVREMEYEHTQNKNHLEGLHEKKVKSLNQELEMLQDDNQKRIRKLENTIREKDEEIHHQVEIQKTQLAQSEQALADFRIQVEKNSNKIYEELKVQMEKVEYDLNRSRQMREKQSKEYQRHIESEKANHLQQVSDLRIAFDGEKSAMLRNFQKEKESVYSEHHRELDRVQRELRNELESVAAKAKERTSQDAKAYSELESQVQELREQLVQSNQLRKQQLVELGLLREEEKQKMQHQHEALVAKLRSEVEQQRLDLEKQHSLEMEDVLGKTNGKLKEIEKEYAARGDKASETNNELQRTIQQMREENNRQREHSELLLSKEVARLVEEKQKLKEQQAETVMQLQQEIENHRNKYACLEKCLKNQEEEAEERLTQSRSDYEARIRGLIPSSVRKELEDTIISLKSQVASLQSRAVVLQEELDLRTRYATTSSSLGNSLAMSLGGSMASVKSNQLLDT